MTEFLATLTHGRKLQGAVKALSVETLEEVVEKLNKIIEVRKQKEAAAEKARKEKQDKLNEICKQMEDAGLNLEDLQAMDFGKKSRRAGQKRPVKYMLTDKNGDKHPWTGIGRMPKVYSQALADGRTLEEFKL